MDNDLGTGRTLFGATFIALVLTIGICYSNNSLKNEEIEYLQNKITEVNERWEGQAAASACARYHPQTGKFEWSHKHGDEK